MTGFSFRRTFAFMRKERFQIARDPSSFLIAVVFPLMLIFLFGYGVSLDANTIRIGLVLEDSASLARDLASDFMHTTYFNVEVSTHREPLVEKLMAAKIRGLVIIPQDFTEDLKRGKTAPVQIIADGTEANTASFVENYAEAVINGWWKKWQRQQGMDSTSINIDSRMWFNPEIKSRYVLLPGSIAVIMALIGILLTALVVAREWERGTMEAIMSTPILISEFVMGKLLPYFFMGLGSMVLCVLFTVLGFHVPFVGSFLIMLVATSCFLFAGLAQGLLISTLTKNQFVASQAAINAAFLPSYMLSGFLYEIESMPTIIQAITYILPARYFVSIIKTIFLAGNIYAIIIPNLIGMLAVGSFFLVFIIRKTKKSLE